MDSTGFMSIFLVLTATWPIKEFSAAESRDRNEAEMKKNGGWRL